MMTPRTSSREANLLTISFKAFGSMILAPSAFGLRLIVPFLSFFHTIVKPDKDLEEPMPILQVHYWDVYQYPIV
jgi:hypothetical protein